MASDIINFLEVEDANLNVSFLTVHCEKIPSQVHEKEAMNDVYVMLHKSQEDYDILMAAVNNSDELVETQGRMMEAMREDMNENFHMLAKMIKDNLPDKTATVTVSTIVDSNHIGPVENTHEGSNPRMTEGTVSTEINTETTIVGSDPTGPVDRIENESITWEEVKNEDACSELEEGEIRDEDDGVDGVGSKKELVYRSALYLKQMRKVSDQEQQQQQLQLQQQKQKEEQQQHLQQQQELHQRQQLQQQQQQMLDMPYEEMMSRSRPHMPVSRFLRTPFVPYRE